VPDDRSPSTLPSTVTTNGARRRRFVLPPVHHEEQASDRVAEGIEAFLAGPSGHRLPRRRHFRTDPLVRPPSMLPLDSPATWDLALHREDGRVARYGRTASVIVIDVVPRAPDLERRDVARIGAVVRTEARATDRIAAGGPTRFHLLLPETTENEAIAVADRIVRSCAELPPDDHDRIAIVRTAVACAIAGATLGDALRLARARLAV
jgi:hypothetical protein